MRQLEFAFENTALRKREEIIEVTRNLEEYLMTLKKSKDDSAYESPESFLRLPFDAPLREQIERTVQEKVSNKLKHIIHIGIGGAALGAQAVVNTLSHVQSSKRTSAPETLFLETIDPYAIERARDVISGASSQQEFLIHLASKGGVTTEPVTNFEALFNLVRLEDKELATRIIVSTASSSPLASLAEKKRISILPVPESIGGRFSIFTPNNLSTLHAAGLDTSALLEGARDITSLCLSPDVTKNPALAWAALMELYYREGIRIHNMFFFHPALETLGRWERQLIGECLGKRYDLDGKEVRAGIVPLISMGSVDLHSMVQLYFGGPKNIFTTFVRIHENKGFDIPSPPFFENLMPELAGKSTNEIEGAIYEGVKTAYRKNGLPYAELSLPDVSPHTLGAYFQCRMIAVALLGKLMHINPFDQPNVDDYKQETRDILESSS